MLAFNPDNWLQLVADNWQELRKCDIFRLFDELPQDHWPELFAAIVANRQDCEPRALLAVGEILADRNPELREDQPYDPKTYRLRVAIWESLGLSTSDAQATTDAEFLRAGKAVPQC